MNPKDIIVCRRPHKLTVGDVRKLLARKDNTARQHLAILIRHRLIERYVTPLEHVQAGFESGFLIMAASCLMIEAFQCYKEGKKDTKGKGQGQAAFDSFFNDYASDFPGVNSKEFYENIRCGILHQAQTQGRYRILRKGAIFDRVDMSINASVFLRMLKRIVENYVDGLHVAEMDSEMWSNALKKIAFICDAIEAV